MPNEGGPRRGRRWSGLVVVLLLLAAPRVRAEEGAGVSGRIGFVPPFCEATGASNNPPETFFGMVGGVELFRHPHLALEAGFSWGFDVVRTALRVGTTPVVWDSRVEGDGHVLQVAVLAEYLHGWWFDPPAAADDRHAVGLLVGLQLSRFDHAGQPGFWGRLAFDVSYAPGWKTWDLNVLDPREADRWWYYPALLVGFAW